MIDEELGPDLLGVCASLSQIPIVMRDRNAALKEIAKLSKQVLRSHACTLTFVNLDNGYLVHVAGAGPDEQFEQHMRDKKVRFGSMLDGELIDYELVAGCKVVELYGLQRNGQGIANPRVAQRYGLNAALCHPLVLGDRLVGYLNHFSAQLDPFTPNDKKLLGTLAEHVVLTIDALDSLINREQLEKLNNAMQQMTQIRDLDQLLALVLDCGLEMVGAERGWISRLDLARGELQIVAHRGEPKDLRTLLPGQGITGKALETEATIRVDDVREKQWQAIYQEYWPDTRSELVVPILIQNAQVRVRTEIELGSKPIGVFNVESPTPRAFSRADEDILTSLMRHTASAVERLEFDRKLSQLVEVQQEILGKQDWDDVIDTMLTTVTNTLGFESVNVSLVDLRHKRIETKYVKGIPEPDVAEFLKRANHSLDSDDIQADIVRTRNVEVPDVEDKRFDPQVYGRFGHAHLIRVFMPMIIPSDDRVIGTVEARYRRTHRKYIYERDIEILRGFVDYVVRALEQKEAGRLDKMSHELRSPTVGIRNNADYLQRRIGELDSSSIQRKLDDIILDCEILLNEVGKVEYSLGRSPMPSRPARTLVFRDIIIKTVHQLVPEVLSQGFHPSRLHYDSLDIRRIEPLYLDRKELNQVVYNLLINAIKYAEKDPDKFAIHIRVHDTRNSFILSFKDWGIGIKPKYRGRIFEPRFRTPEATKRYPTGSGLGLYMSRNSMRELGGDLELVNLAKPTEFHIVLPKRLAEVRQ